jgi:xeroderma pigmentosum group C-complementing protein
MSLTPLWLQNSFQMISKKTQPDKNRRGRQFEAAVRQLTAWWLENFDLDTVPGVRSRPFEDVQAELLSKGFILTPSAFSLSFSAQAKGKGKAKAQTAFYDEDELAEGEIIKSSKSLMKHALRMSGSADTSAQLYTALCRAIGVPARLVVSLQGVPWRKRSETTPKKKGKTGTKSMPSTEVDSDDDMEEVFPEPVKVDRKGKGKAVDNFPGEGQTLSGKLAKAKSTSPIKLRQSRPQGRTLRDTVSIDSPPIFWTEVFSRPDGRWIPVDPIRGTVDKKRSFEPASNDRTNRMVYVVAFEEGTLCR